jgi:hypothetical protein
MGTKYNNILRNNHPNLLEESITDPSVNTILLKSDPSLVPRD